MTHAGSHGAHGSEGASWPSWLSLCCAPLVSSEDRRPRRIDEKRSYPVIYDQPIHHPQPVAMPEHRKMSERSTRDSVSLKRRRFWSLSPSSRRPLISAPSDFRHVSTAADPFLDYPEPTPSRASNLRPAKQLPHRPYRPLELSIYQSDNGVSPIMPHFEPRPANPAPSSDYSDCVSDSQPEEVKPSLEHQKSFSDSPMSFHFPRRQALGSAPSSSHGEDEIPPLIPPKSPGRPRAYSSPDVEKVKERVANAMLEVEKLQKQIDDVIERQSLYVPSRPPTPHSVARTMPGMSSIYGPGDEPLPPTSSDLEPMPSIPALPPAAPSFAQRLNSDIIERPHTAPIRPPRTPVRTPITPPRRSRTPGEQRSPSTPPSRPRRDDMPPPPPLPLVLRPPLRKKKSFSRVSSWLFPGSQHNRNMSFDSVTNAPRPIRGNQGFYQVSLGGASEHRRSTESVDTVSTWESDDENRTVPTTCSVGSTAAVSQDEPLISRFATSTFGRNDTRPQRRSVGVAM
ncbi:hypothetical protein FOQG_06377 [Fusarium oxysporum f. sp. raphani 54005]|uniref:Uncharacterized protein n=3 Tax=Fusarium oxysporum TaxID=5507 RepID=X0CK95_FUSOX|nr:hypothetical protein FOVG_08438 [Fusarium oxysporum f. sp. pisi HDV247]EXK91693.1 hypothetical protein FOQG_06377 [Fusarium oxysporum f. sp. raphani 54005]KAG7433820.1 hypothetical protein Forpi1262_v004986 [Fusarium oxysporum f. sp. raphani]